MKKINLFGNKKQRAPKGSQLGAIADVYLSTEENSKGEEIEAINIVTQLVAQDRMGDRFALTKTLLLGERGVGTLAKHVQNALGRELTDSELAEFDAEALLLGKPVTVEVEHRKDTGKDIAVIVSFAPANDTTIAVSPNFKRQTDAELQPA